MTSNSTSLENKRSVSSSPVSAEKKAKLQRQSSLFEHFTKNKPESLPSSQPDEKIPGPASDSSQLDNSVPMKALSDTPASGLVSTSPSAESKPSLPVASVDLSTLSEDEKKIIELELAELPSSWLSILWNELKKPYFQSLKAFLRGERERGVKVFPPPSQIYHWAKLCPLEQIKVVILGQDPYHNDGQAMGLCFSVPAGMTLPPSLINIYKELSTDISSFNPIPKDGDLSAWARQGVLLLNTSLTVRAHEPASHAGKGWEQFTDAVIRAISAHHRNCVFILWGNHAQKKSPMIDRGRHLVLMGVHPSPLSANRGFFGCKHFSKTNEYLIGHGKEPINWKL